MAAPLGTIQNPASVQTRMLGVGRSFSRCYVFESGSIYRVVRQIRECIYGYVKLAIRVQNTGEELILTDERVAIKQMNIVSLNSLSFFKAFGLDPLSPIDNNKKVRMRESE